MPQYRVIVTLNPTSGSHKRLKVTADSKKVLSIKVSLETKTQEFRIDFEHLEKDNPLQEYCDNPNLGAKNISPDLYLEFCSVAYALCKSATTQAWYNQRHKSGDYATYKLGVAGLINYDLLQDGLLKQILNAGEIKEIDHYHY